MVNSWLIGAITINDKIVSIENEIERDNLVKIPELLKYTRCQYDQDIYFFINSIGVCICIWKYHDFDKKEEMEEDYCKASSIHKDGSKYTKAYEHCIVAVKDKYKLEIEDLDWVMPIVVGEENCIGSDFAYIKTLDYIIGTNKNIDKNKDINSLMLLDASSIYQSMMTIGEFFTRDIKPNGLLEYKLYQMSYYLHELLRIESPEYFLTNQKEKEIMREYYEKWRIQSQMEIVIKMAKQSMDIYNFVSTNKTDFKTSISTIFMGFLSFILMCDPIRELLELILPRFTYEIIIIEKFLVFFCCIGLLYAVGKTVINYEKEKVNFKNHTK